MVDTVKLTIDCKNSLLSHFGRHVTFVKGFPQAWLDVAEYASSGCLYHPQISYMERPINGGYTHELSVEVSLPKLLFGNNIEEVREDDLHLIVKKLYDSLQDLGFTHVSEDDILHARVIRFDIGKNVILKGAVDVGNTIRNLRVVNLGGSHEEYERDFAGGGTMVGWRIKSGEDITFYDKTAEANRRHGRISPSLTTRSILRFETKLRNTKIIRSRLKNANIDAPRILTFESLFKDEICRSLIIYEFDRVYGRTPKADLDVGIWQAAQSIASEEQGKRGGFTRWLKRVARIALTQAMPNGASLDKLVQDSFGQHNKYGLHRIREGPTMNSSQLREIIAVRRCIEEFKPLTAANLKD